MEHNPGLNPHNVSTFGLSLPPTLIHAKPEEIRNAFREFDEKIAAIPGVQAVSQTWGALPFDADDEQLFLLEGQPKPENENDMNWAIDYIVEPGYLKAMGIPLKRGRFSRSRMTRNRLSWWSLTRFSRRNIFRSRTRSESESRSIASRASPRLSVWWGTSGSGGLDADEQQTLRSELYIPAVQMPDDFVAICPQLGNGRALRSGIAGVGCGGAPC